MAKIIQMDGKRDTTVNPITCSFCGATVGTVIRSKSGKTICPDCIADCKAMLPKE